MQSGATDVIYTVSKDHIYEGETDTNLDYNAGSNINAANKTYKN